MRLIFAGTPEFAAQALDALIGAGHEIALVLTQPDRPAGRGMSLAMSAVKQLALKHDLTVLQPASLREPEIQAQLAAAGVEVMVVAAYGLILPQAVLDIPLRGCLNIHASLLPRWRGAAPIQRAILAGDAETGITIMQMDEGLDTGAMLLKFPVPIMADDTAETLHDKLAVLGGDAIVAALSQLQVDVLGAQPQDDRLATYAAKLTKAEGKLDWGRSAHELERAVRAYNPFPVAQAAFRGVTWRIWQATTSSERGAPGEVLRADKDGVLVACGEGALLLQGVQKAGGKRLPMAQFLPGNPVRAGERFDA
ncbi:methionyl-tRNA formyltransferase [Sulfurimicrobium lacus]|uniref:Methionyl-tRNA formyltransferase n=1 Tax=Sulfurimicrobium lacus TaxID=2715678 RepID=A0A6F8V5M0_9PROT|nr:methionyl-tRNA formyltransferase [Sulfurimicrobium lacus]BCB25123.1 methionyl-tRNA formyltransferase [Sulfurimicrobium lacus]